MVDSTYSTEVNLNFLKTEPDPWVWQMARSNMIELLKRASGQSDQPVCRGWMKRLLAEETKIVM